jgi:hypothetical protein
VTPAELFEALIAEPREAGTPGAARARTLLAEHLRGLGYAVREQPFSFQPAALLALPLLGAGLGWLTLLQVPLLLLGRLPGALAPLTWFGGCAALGLLAWGIGTGIEVPGAERREDANLIATRGAAAVRCWIVAHVDTKAQGHSMAGRLVAVWLVLGALLTLSVLVVWRAARGDALPVWAVAAGAGLSLAAGALAGRGRLRGASPGARDNGTGLLAALVAAGAAQGEGLGFVFTGAEEFGLVGARAFIGAEAAGAVEVLNLDTLTDQGRLYLVAHDDRGVELARRLLPTLLRVAPEVRIRRLPIGILTDSLPFSRAGCPAVTLSRLTWADLRRLHTARDTGEELGISTALTLGLILADLR